VTDSVRGIERVGANVQIVSLDFGTCVFRRTAVAMGGRMRRHVTGVLRAAGTALAISAAAAMPAAR